MKKGRTLWLALALGATTLPAHALATFNEVEPNNTRASAQFLNTLDNNILVHGSRRNANQTIARSPDWYRFSVTGPSYLNLGIRSVGTGASSARLIFGLYDSSGTFLFGGGGPTVSAGSGSLTLAGAGSYYLAITGYSAQNFAQLGTGNFLQSGTNAGSFNWNYDATINYTTVPEPSEWAVIGLSVLGVGGLMARARRKPLSSLA
jgi:hypothetical protein